MPADTSFKVHLLRAPDYKPNDYFELCKILQSLPMPGWEFIPAENELFPEDGPYQPPQRLGIKLIRFDYVSPVHKHMYQGKRGYDLSWHELFDVCRNYRRSLAIDERHFVVLLTDCPNDLNWFSSFDQERHIFIHTSEWERYLHCAHHYPVGYEVIANVLQSQMKLNTEGKDACLHTETIGCMNDFCLDKREIAIKLRTADMCPACTERLQQCEVAEFLANSALQGFEALRIQMLFSQGFKRSGGPGVLEVTWLYQFKFPNLGSMLVEFTPLERTLYAFFLKNPEGMSRVDLMNYGEELLKIYGRISGKDAGVQRERIERLINPMEGSFNQNCTRINSKIEKKLGPMLAAPYKIEGTRGGVYAIAIASQDGMVLFNEH